MKKALAFLLLSVLLLAGATPAGVDQTQLAKIAPRMKAIADSGLAPGIVTLVQHKGEVALLDATGWQDIDKKIPMKPDTIFEVMSMTKPVTAAGIMMLVEDGLISLADPVERLLPEFRGLWVIDSKAPDGKAQSLRRPARAPTVRDLLTHTSGMRELPPDSMGGGNFYRAMDKTLAEAVAMYSQQPLEFDPGTKWSYSNPGMATLGRIIEVVSGQPYEKFLDQRLFQPLGMKDSFFFPPAEKRDRIARVYQYEGAKRIDVGDYIFRKGVKYSMPEGGLYSTAQDMAAFYQMMLNGGAYKGKRLLSKATVEVMTMNHTGDLPLRDSTANGQGLGWQVARTPFGALSLASLGAYGHGGAFGTYGWIDPKKELVGVFMVQRASGGADHIRRIFQAMASAAVSELR